MTILSLVLTIGVNLLVWPVLIWTAIENPVGMLDHILLVFATELLLFVNFVGLVFVLIGTWRKEEKPRLRKVAYAVSIFSFPIYYLGIVLFV